MNVFYLDILRFCGDVKGGDACYTFGEDTVSYFFITSVTTLKWIYGNQGPKGTIKEL